MSQPYFINYQRGLANTEICQNYVKDLIVQIRNTNMHNAPSHLTIGNKIKNCLVYVKRKIVEFENSNYGRGLRMNCTNQRRVQFVEQLLQIIENSDYIKMLYAIERQNRIDYDPVEDSIIRRLAIRYGKLRELVRILGS